MPEFLEKKLKAEYGAKSSIPYAVMNAQGLMHGSKETAKGRALQAKHEEDQKKKRKPKRQASGLDWRKRWGRNKVKGDKR